MECKGSSANGFIDWFKPSKVTKNTINFANPRIKIKASNHNYILRIDPEANKGKTMLLIQSIVWFTVF